MVRMTELQFFPISRQLTDAYNGQEFLGVYPYVNQDADRQGKQRLWIHRSPTVMWFSTIGSLEKNLGKEVKELLSHGNCPLEQTVTVNEQQLGSLFDGYSNIIA